MFRIPLHALLTLFISLPGAAMAADSGQTRLALVNAQGTVVNIVVASPGWQPPTGLTAIYATESAELGGSWDGGRFQPRTTQPREAATSRRQILTAHIEDIWTAIDAPTQPERDAARQRVRDALKNADTTRE